MLSETNDLLDPKELSVHHDMSRPMAHYWIHSSHNTFLRGAQVPHKSSYLLNLPLQINDDASLTSYEVALRMGVRCIDIDVHNGELQDGALIPWVHHAGRLVPSNRKLRLDRVLETIQRHAFSVSKFPLIISLDISCNHENQNAIANILVETFGNELLTEQVFRSELELPSPEQLKEKIILNAQVGDAIKDQSKQQDFFHIGKVWFRMDTTGSEWQQQEMIWSKNSLRFGFVRSEKVTTLFNEPYFVGNLKLEDINKFIKKQTKRDGSFLIRSNESYDTFYLAIFVGNDVLHVPLVFEDDKIFINTRLDRGFRFDSMKDLIKHFQALSVSHRVKLKKPIDLRNTDIHKYADWFVGNINKAECRNIMRNVKKKLFLSGRRKTNMEPHLSLNTLMEKKVAGSKCLLTTEEEFLFQTSLTIHTHLRH